MNISRSLTIALHDAKMRKQRLAYELGVSNVQVSRYCSGTTVPSSEVVANICEIIGISVEDFHRLGEKYVDVQKHKLQEEKQYAILEAVKGCEQLAPNGLICFSDSLIRYAKSIGEK